MIGSLSGGIKAIYAPFVLIEVAGVGYEVETPLTTFCELKKDTQVFLWTHLVVREDAQLLYGFLTQNERDVFRTLIKINGVGAKLAIAMLSNMDTATLANTIQAGDDAGLTQIPGIGKKTAQRLVVELKDKLKDHAVDGAVLSADSTAQSKSQADHAKQEALAALQSLGYSTKEAEKTVTVVLTELPQQQDATNVQDIIRLSLKYLSGR